jgi:hypothetical protein
MNITITVLLATFLSLFSSITYAQDDVKGLLMTGETQKIRQAAKIMTSGEQNTLENAHLLAKIIEQEFETAPANRIDALSWGCRALGATGNSHYSDLLQRIYQSNTAHKKLKKYAKKAYQTLPAKEQAVTINISPPTNTSNVNSQTSQRPESSINPIHNKPLPNNDKNLNLVPKATLSPTQRKIFAIAKRDWPAVKFIAQQAEKNEELNTQVLDTLSQFLIEMHPYKLDNEKIDVLAWICRALGHSSDGRYYTILQQVAKDVSNSKLRKYAASANNELPKSSTVYIIGSINFQQIINEYSLK